MKFVKSPNKHDWKVCVGQKLTGGSNPPLSARSKPPQGGFFHLAAESGGFDVAKSKGVAWQANA